MATPDQGISRARGRPTSDEAAEIDRQILLAARQLFFSEGYERTSMATIVKTAGVSKTTLYARYETKAELFRATVLLTVDRIANDSLSPVERTVTELDAGLRVFGRNALIISAAPIWSNYERLVFAEGLRFPELSGIVAERIEVGVSTVATFVEECARRDGVPCRDPRAIGAIYIMALRGFYTAGILRGQYSSAEQGVVFVDALVDRLLASRADW